MMAPQRLSEFDVIEQYFAPLAGPAGLGLKDDAALLTVPADHDLVTTVDAIVAGVHFLPDDPPATIGWKALGVNVSDLAAKGAAPLGFLLTLALPADTEAGWLADFADGLGRAATLWQCPLVGGDTVTMPGPLTLSITAFGTVPKGAMVRRAGARPGDVLAVTGTIGDAALGLPLATGQQTAWSETLSASDRAYLMDRYRRPRPRIGLASLLRDHASAAMDVSDGLLGDAAKLLAISGVGAKIDAQSVPLSEAARHVLAAHPASLERVLTGGDDYEILCTVPTEKWDSFVAGAVECGVAVTSIGHVTGDGALDIMGPQGPLSFARLSYTHFSQERA
jgi:thiamine-monophosphate kinase